ncbi:MAG: hypothetical protein AAB688_01570 [Patescibacteria group bacterium]
MEYAKEYIVCAAVWYKDGGVYIHQPKNIEDGFVVAGRRHHNCFITVKILRGEAIKKIEPTRVTQGFISSEDRFVSRIEAASIAYKAGQINKSKQELFSEDLY